VFQTKVLEKTHFTFSNFFWKSCCSWNNVQKCGTARQATDDNTVQCMHIACWITKATAIHPEYVILVAFAWWQWVCEHA